MVGLGNARGHPQENALRSQIQHPTSGPVLKREAGQAVFQDTRRAVVTKNPSIGDKAWMQRQSQQPVLWTREDGQGTHRFETKASGIPDRDATPTFSQHHTAIAGDIECNGLAQPVSQHAALKPRLGLRGRRTCGDPSDQAHRRGGQQGHPHGDDRQPGCQESPAGTSPHEIRFRESAAPHIRRSWRRPPYR